jgi:hypothetical protein
MKEDFLNFATSSKGRIGRVVLGLVILALGMFVIQGTIGKVMTLMGLVPIAGGLFDFCLAGLMLGYPLSGEKVRQMLAGRKSF